MVDPVYRAAAPEMLDAVTLGDLTALYHRASAQTHLVIEPMPQILAALATSMSLEQLCGALNVKDRETLEARLAELEAIGLVWRA